MRILITGASGFVGTKLYNLFRQSGHEVFGTSHQNPKENLIPLNLSDMENINSVFDQTKPDIVIHAAGIARAEACIKNPELAFRVNVLGTARVARACRERNILLTYLSSSHVFPNDGKLHPESEIPVKPFGFYGELKRQAELFVRHELGINHIIVRTELLLGFNKEGPNHIFGNTVNGILTLKADKIRQPMLIEDLASAIHTLLDKEQRGTFHLTGPDFIPHSSLLEAISHITGARIQKEGEIKMQKGALLDGSKALSLGIITRDFNSSLFELESQLKSAFPEGQRMGPERG